MRGKEEKEREREREKERERERETDKIHTYASSRDAYIYTRDTRLRFEYLIAVYRKREEAVEK